MTLTERRGEGEEERRRKARCGHACFLPRDGAPSSDPKRLVCTDKFTHPTPRYASGREFNDAHSRKSPSPHQKSIAFQHPNVSFLSNPFLSLTLLSASFRTASHHHETNSVQREEQWAQRQRERPQGKEETPVTWARNQGDPTVTYRSWTEGHPYERACRCGPSRPQQCRGSSATAHRMERKKNI